jgi:hypothetical protein
MLALGLMACSEAGGNGGEGGSAGVAGEGGQGGGGVGGHGGTCGTPLDVAGGWLITATPIEDTCDGDLSSYMFLVTITQDGSALAGQAFGAVFPGTICGDQIEMGGSFAEYGETTTVNIQLTVSAEGNSLDGSDTWNWTDGVESCGGSESLSGTLIDAPPGWTCPVEFYGTADGCDCGCGVIDPDCFDGTVASCEYCDGPGSCSDLLGCPGNIAPAQNWLCATAVCGDNIINQATEVCDGTDLFGLTCADLGFTGGALACNATCDNLDATACTGGPADWTCPPEYYGTFDGCDCGCGVIDPDCIDGTVGSCEYCGGPGSCSPLFSDCPGDIDPTQNWLCSA